MRIGRSQSTAAKHQHRDEQHAFAANGVGDRPEQQAADQQAEQPRAEGGGELSGQQIPLFAQRRRDIADDGGIETVQKGNEETQGQDQDLVGEILARSMISLMRAVFGLMVIPLLFGWCGLAEGCSGQA